MIDVFCSHCGPAVKMRRYKNRDMGYKEAYKCIDSCNAITFIAQTLPSISKIQFMPDGEAYVYDDIGSLIPEYKGTHKETIRLLDLDGIDYLIIPNITGKPQL